MNNNMVKFNNIYELVCTYLNTDKKVALHLLVPFNKNSPEEDDKRNIYHTVAVTNPCCYFLS